MPAFIPTPEDFAEQAHRTTRDLAAFYGVHAATVRNFRDRLGLPQMPANSLPRDPRPMPDDFMEHATKMPVTACARHYKVCDHTARRWYQEMGIHRPRKRSPMPADFADFASTTTIADLRAKYGICYDTVYRWEAATGVKCLRDDGGSAMKRKAASRVKPLKVRKTPKPPKVVKEKPVEFVRAAPPPRKVHKARATGLRDHGPLRDMTRAGQAADFLRKLDAVRRCDAKGAFSLTGDHWHFRGRLFNAAGIVERAERAGFDPDAWMRIAA